MSEIVLVLARLLALATSPVGAVILLGLVAALVLGRYRRLGRALILIAVIGLWIAAMPAFANWLYAGLEARYPPAPVAALPEADVAILLGGIVGQPLPPRTAPDLGEPADRLFHAVRLYRAGKVRFILVTGGNLPWRAAVSPEADLLADLLVEFGVPREAITVETAARNTHENAINSAAIMNQKGWRTALLVTSGAHMPRSMAVFRAAGVDVTPAATDIRVRYPLVDGALDFLPDADALRRTSDGIREWIGLAAYRLRGWA